MILYVKYVDRDVHDVNKKDREKNMRVKFLSVHNLERRGKGLVILRKWRFLVIDK